MPKKQPKHPMSHGTAYSNHFPSTKSNANRPCSSCWTTMPPAARAKPTSFKNYGVAGPTPSSQKNQADHRCIGSRFLTLLLGFPELVVKAPGFPTSRISDQLTSTTTTCQAGFTTVSLCKKCKIPLQLQY